MNYCREETDCFVGRRQTLSRFLITSGEGYFPVLQRVGDLLAVVFRTGGAHIGANGTLATCYSADGGQAWSDPIAVAPRWRDVRNPAFGHNFAGEWIVAWWEATLHRYRPDPAGGGLRWYSGDEEPEAPALFVARSSDRGATWATGAPYKSALLSLASPFGRIVRHRGSLLLPAAGRPRGSENRPDRAIVIRSSDDGQTWGDESLVAEDHNEMALCSLPGNELLAILRHVDHSSSVCRSSDDGRTWTPPQNLLRRMEHPADLTLLASGNLLLTFGRRRRPIGCGALLSHDLGITWDRGREAILAGDGVRNDVGYPSTVQRSDGGLVTALYFAGGCSMSETWTGCGEVSAQALHYREEDLFS